MSNENLNFFQREDGATVPAISREELEKALTQVWNELEISPLQSVEAAAYSFAMVVRFALGLSAEGGLVCAVVNDGFPGAVALSCLRHLTNGGAEGVALIVKDDSNSGTSQESFSRSLKTISALGINTTEISSPQEIDVANDIFSNCHNILFGLSRLQAHSNEQNQSELNNKIVEALNEQSTPVHCVLSPYGVLEEGGELLFASSTLSMGAPLANLTKHPDNIGRHYLADLSFPPSLYQSLSEDFPYLFSEQPVIQLYPKE